MTQPFIFTAEQAQTFNTTGHIEGFKELCEWQPPRITRAIAGMDDDGTWFCNWENDWYQSRRKELTPTRAVGQVYACKEPCIVEDESQHASFLVMNAYNMPSGKWRNCTADEMPDWAIRLHAKIATEPTLEIHEGKLVWTYDLVKE